MFQIPPANGIEDGSSDDHPLYLDGIAKSDFAPLLKVMFPTEMDERKETPPITVLDDWRVVENKANGRAQAKVSSSWKEWASVLKLSAMYQMGGFEKMATKRICTLATAESKWEDVLRVSTAWRLHGIRERAIEALDRREPNMAKLRLAMDCGVENWLLAVYRRLVQRSETISEAEEETLGQQTTYKLFLLRHRCILRIRGYSSTEELENAIRGHFQDEMKKVNDSRDHYTIDAPSSSSEKKNAATALQHDQWFYFTNPVFIVEDTLFRIPMLHFERHWEHILSHSSVTQPSLNKSLEMEPLLLEGVTKTDFHQLLRVMFLPMNCRYYSQGDSKETHSGSQKEDSMSWRDWASVYLLSNMWGIGNIRDKSLLNLPANLEEWIEVLRLSTAWRLPNIRQKAIQSLATYAIDSKVAIEVAIVCDVPELLLRGYRALVKRPAEISVEEAKWLGWKTAMRLLRIRDQFLSSSIRRYSSDLMDRVHDPDSDLRSVIRDKLKEVEHVN